MDASKRIEDMITAPLENLGYEVVRVQISGSQRQTLQVMAERLDGKPIVVEDCATISRTLSALFDVEDPISGAYTLEVSSPGLDRPLTRPKDFARFAGLEARIELRRLIDGRRRFRGKLAGLDNDTVRIDVDGTVVELPFAEIDRAKLILTDELLALAGAGDVQH
ncbi:MAG: ribosome maturation factor RimP [Proteobacteria bacterium]|jgi:ribosome maturation factor RimP|nr:ribosome maturation factor RimP [Pseudomonadota bacterium]